MAKQPEKPKAKSVASVMSELMQEPVVFENEEVSGTVAMARLLRKVMLSSKEPTNLRLQAVNMILDQMEEKKQNRFDPFDGA